MLYVARSATSSPKGRHVSNISRNRHSQEGPDGGCGDGIGNGQRQRSGAADRIRMPALRERRQRAGTPGSLATGAQSGRGSDGIHGAIVEAAVAGSGAAFPEITFGAGPLQQGAERTEERLWRRETADAADGGRGVDLEFRAGCRAAYLAYDNAQQAATGARSCAIAESTGSSAGG